LVCGSDNTCQDATTACTANGNTTACLNAQGPAGGACLTCAAANGCLDPALLGGTCEGTTGTQPHFSGTLPDGTTCATAFSQGASETEAKVCLETLGTIFGSKCAAQLQETPCLCGTTDPASCLGGQVTPNGPEYDQVACDFNSVSIDTIQGNYTNQALGVGQANALVQCLAAFNCSCF
jgi:hypothetical protein